MGFESFQDYLDQLKACQTPEVLITLFGINTDSSHILFYGKRDPLVEVVNTAFRSGVVGEWEEEPSGGYRGFRYVPGTVDAVLHPFGHGMFTGRPEHQIGGNNPALILQLSAHQRERTAEKHKALVLAEILGAFGDHVIQEGLTTRFPDGNVNYFPETDRAS